MSERVKDAPQSLREVIEQFVRAESNKDGMDVRLWLQNLVKRAPSVQAITHNLKPQHPSIKTIEHGKKIVTELSVLSRPRASKPSSFHFVATLSLPASDIELDFSGNAALKLQDFALLRKRWKGETVLELARQRDPELCRILSSDEGESQQMCRELAALTDGPSLPASSPLAKQAYFPLPGTSETPEYHLLAPLFPTSLVHKVCELIRDDRFGEASKAARAAKGADAPFAHGYREYPNLAIQQCGGNKPQNISQLNNERHGENWLLPCLPPNWDADPVKAPLHCESVFGSRFGRSREARELLTELREFLETTTHNNMNIRRKRARLVDAVCALAHDFAAGVQALEPGWSLAPECELHVSEQHWLDPNRAALDSEFAAAHAGNWTSVVAHRFANWFNQALNSERLQLSEDEHQQWASDFGEGLTCFLTELEDARA